MSRRIILSYNPSLTDVTSIRIFAGVGTNEEITGTRTIAKYIGEATKLFAGICNEINSLGSLKAFLVTNGSIFSESSLSGVPNTSWTNRYGSIRDYVSKR
jgi:hypothetical protein